MTTEYGIFNGEELVEGQFYSRAIARTAAAELAATEDYEGETLEVHEVCPDHSEQGKDWCPICNAEINDEPVKRRRNRTS